MFKSHVMVMLTCFPAHSKKDPSWLKIKIGESLPLLIDQPATRYKWFSGEFKISDHIEVEILTSHSGGLSKAHTRLPPTKPLISAGMGGCEYLVRCSFIPHLTST